jgi:hypothetical protein
MDGVVTLAAAGTGLVLRYHPARACSQCKPHGDFHNQPLAAALVIPYENGTVVSLPPAFKGPVYKATPIPGDLRLSLLRSALSVFNGSTTHLPLMEEYVSYHSRLQPRVVPVSFVH